jgi:hypothetical protein
MSGSTARSSPQQVVDTLAALSSAASEKPGLGLESLEGLCSRVVVHGEEMDNLLAEEYVKHAFCAGPDWLHRCMLPGSTARDWLLSLGFESEWLANTIGGGKRFTLLVFRPAADRGFAATWANIFEKALPDAFPGEAHATLRARVCGHRAALEATSFEEIERLAVGEGCEHMRSGRDGHGHLAAVEYMAAGNTLVNCRRFLRKEFNLTPLFGGRGFTVNEDGSQGCREVMVLNGPVSELPELAILPLPTGVLLPST